MRKSKASTLLPEPDVNGATPVAYVGGAAYQKLGVVKPWPNQSGSGRIPVDQRRHGPDGVQGSFAAEYQKDGPYFHDGSVATLDQAIRNMAVHQRGVTLTDAQVKSIEAWMGSLTGEIPASYINSPELPKSTAQTPPADGRITLLRGWRQHQPRFSFISNGVLSSESFLAASRGVPLLTSLRHARLRPTASQL